LLDDDDAWGDCVSEGLSRGERQSKTKMPQRHRGTEELKKQKRGEAEDAEIRRAAEEKSWAKVQHCEGNPRARARTTEQSSEDKTEI
jgi:hypothetical protein